MNSSYQQNLFLTKHQKTKENIVSWYYVLSDVPIVFELIRCAVKPFTVDLNVMRLTYTCMWNLLK
jgi:hypothetical protein